MEKKIIIDLCNPEKMSLCPRALSEDMKRLTRFAPSCMDIWNNCPKPKLTRYLSAIHPFQPCISCNKLISKLPLQCQVKARSHSPCFLSGKRNTISRKLSYIFIFGGSLTIILPCSECPISDESDHEEICIEIHNNYPLLEELDGEDLTFLNNIIGKMFDESLEFLLKSSKLQAAMDYLKSGAVQPVRLQETISSSDRDLEMEMRRVRTRESDRTQEITGELARPYEGRNM